MNKENIEKRLTLLANGEKCKISKAVGLKDGAHLVIFNLDGEDCSCIVYDDETLFVLSDWQSGYPKNIEEVNNYQWLAEGGHDAIIFSGLPRVL